MRHAGLIAIPLIGAVVIALLLPDAIGIRPPVNRAEVTGVSLIRSYYAAVAVGFQTGDFVAVTDLLTSDFVDHPNLADDSVAVTGMLDQLVGLRATYTDLDVVPGEILVDGDRITAMTVMTGRQRPDVLGFALPDMPFRRRGIDVFRVVDGKIAERWEAGDAVTRFRPLVETPFAAYPPIPSIVALARLTIAPGTWFPGSTLPGPGLVLVESGTLTVVGNGISVLVHDGGGGDATLREVNAPGTVTSLHPGEAVIFPTARPMIRNDGTVPVTALAVAIFPSEAAARLTRSHAANTNGEPPPSELLALLMAPQPDEGVGSAPSGVAVTPIARGMLTTAASDPSKLGLGRIVLAPGAGIPPHVVSGVAVVAVESGAIAVDNNGMAALVGKAGEEEPVLVPDSELLLAVGDSAGFEAGSTVTIRNAGEQPAVVLIVTIGTGIDSGEDGLGTSSQ